MISVVVHLMFLFLRIGDGDNVVQVISTNGDTHLGGDDIDEYFSRLVCQRNFKGEQSGINVSAE